MKPKILQMVSKMLVKIYVNASNLAKHLRHQHPGRYKKKLSVYVVIKRFEFTPATTSLVVNS